jgi:pimeloyl-ACP methyl ester carboxylesterase
MSTIEAFEAPYQGWRLKGDQYIGDGATNTLYLHGAGTSSRAGYVIPRGALVQRGIGTVAFDCIGHGETGGELAQSSVASRTRQAEAVIAARGMQGPLALIGSSMGAYNAIKLCERHEVASLVLIVPGVYTPGAYELPFGPGFSNAIRRERSWVDSDAWAILSQFTGRLLVIAAEFDLVIPREIPERLVDAAHCAQSRALHIVRGAEHNRLFSLLRESPADLDHTVGLMADCVQMAAC